jgi:hypothetical protein
MFYILMGVKRISVGENPLFSLFLAEFLSIEFLDFFIFVLSGVTFNVVLPLRLSFMFSSLPSRFGTTTPQLMKKKKEGSVKND